MIGNPKNPRNPRNPVEFGNLKKNSLDWPGFRDNLISESKDSSNYFKFRPNDQIKQSKGTCYSQSNECQGVAGFPWIGIFTQESRELLKNL